MMPFGFFFLFPWCDVCEFIYVFFLFEYEFSKSQEKRKKELKLKGRHIAHNNVSNNNFILV